MKYRRLANFSMYSMGTVFVGAINVLLLPVYSSKISPNDYGLITLIMIVPSIAVILLDSGLTSAYAIRFYRMTTEERTQAAKTIFLYDVTISAILLLAGFVLRRPLSGLAKQGLDPVLLIEVGVLIVFTLTSNFYLCKARMQEKALLYFAMQVSRAVILAIGNILAFVVLKADYRAYFLVVILSMLPSFVGCAIDSLKNAAKPSFRSIVPLLKLGWPLMASITLGVVYSSSDKYILGKMLSVTMVGIYAMGYRVGTLMDQLISGPLGLTINPILYKDFAEGESKYTDRMPLILLLILGVILTAAMAFISGLDLVYRILINRQYWQSYSVSILICVSLVFNSISSSLSNTILLREKTHIAPFILLFSCFVNIGLNVLLVPHWGMMGAGIALLLANIVMLVVNAVLSQHLAPAKYRVGRYISMFAVAVVFGTLMFALSPSVAAFTPLRLIAKLALFGVYCFVVYRINHKEFSMILTMLKKS